METAEGAAEGMVDVSDDGTTEGEEPVVIGANTDDVETVVRTRLEAGGSEEREPVMDADV